MPQREPPVDPLRVQRELSTFQDIWQGGYREGDPQDPVGGSSYFEFGYISVIYAVYRVCVAPYIQPSSIVLEIGPGRGAWTKGMLSAAEVWCLDAKPRQDNGIDAYLGHPANLHYHQVRDFECRELPDNHFDFMFSFGSLCHVSFAGIESYARNLFTKLRPGAQAFWMVADYDKANRLYSQPHHFNVVHRLRAARRIRILRSAYRRIARHLHLAASEPAWLSTVERFPAWGLRRRPAFKDKQEGGEPAPGRWYHAGTQRTVDMLQEAGYVVVCRDVDLVPRDPVVHFRKP